MPRRLDQIVQQAEARLQLRDHPYQDALCKIRLQGGQRHDVCITCWCVCRSDIDAGNR